MHWYCVAHDLYQNECHTWASQKQLFSHDFSPAKTGGPWGKSILVGGISGIITFSGFYIKRGELSADDPSDFPEPLKRKLVVLHGCMIGLLLLMTGLAAVAKFDLV